MNNDILPENFDGVFRFTNFTDTDFKAKWGNVEYTFPAMKTTPMVMNSTPLEIQHIRKKFAKELAILEFYKTPKFVGMNAHTPGGTPALYTDADLAPLIQRCLEPLPLAQMKAKILPKTDESKFSKDSKGRNVTKILEKDESLLQQASGAIEE